MRYVLVLLIINIIYMQQVWTNVDEMQQVQCENLKGTIVDLDKVRIRYMEQLEYAYGRGCRYGTDYPEEFREVTGFNPNSPSNYCNEKYKQDMIDYVSSQMLELTK